MHGLQRRGDGVSLVAIDLFRRLSGYLRNVYCNCQYQYSQDTKTTAFLRDGTHVISPFLVE
jgi:hypothetical protein